jgi:hypothetical protein
MKCGGTGKKSWKKIIADDHDGDIIAVGEIGVEAPW